LSSSSRSRSWARTRRTRKMSAQQSRRGARSRDILPLAVGVVLIFIVGMVLASGLHRWTSSAALFTVEDVRVTGLIVGGYDEIVPNRDELVGRNIFAVDLDSLSANLSTNPRVRNVQAVRRLPGTIEIRIAERSPVALVNWGALVEIDGEGTVLPPQATRLPPDLPIVSGIQPPPGDIYGRRLESNEAEMVLDLLHAIATVEPLLIERVSEIVVDGERGIVLTMADADQHIYLGMGNFRQKLLHLTRVVREISERRRRPRVFDLRFRDQVVVRF